VLSTFRVSQDEISDENAVASSNIFSMFRALLVFQLERSASNLWQRPNVCSKVVTRDTSQDETLPRKAKALTNTSFRLVNRLVSHLLKPLPTNVGASKNISSIYLNSTVDHADRSSLNRAAFLN
jgi:hypothetical protein